MPPTSKNRGYSRTVWLALLALILALFVVGFASLGYAVSVMRTKIVDSEAPLSPPSNITQGAAFGTWFIDSVNLTIPLAGGDKVPYIMPEAVQGVVATGNYTFRLPSDGYYLAQYQVISFTTYYFGLFINPDNNETRRMVNGSSLRSDGQKEDMSVTPIFVTFHASADDEVAVIYMGTDFSPDDPAIIGTGINRATTPAQQPQAYLQLLQLQ